MDYCSVVEKLKTIQDKYLIKVIGESHFGRKIFAVEKHIRSDFFTAFLVAGVHAREHISTDLVLKFLSDGLFDKINGFNVCVVPMLNPDGVELSCHGIESAPAEEKINLLDLNQGSQDFSLWKANGRGVDINNNFDANFDENVHSLSPAPSGFRGKFPESEPETRAIVTYLAENKPFIVLCYHSKGEELYYNFFQEGRELERDTILAERFAKSTGYSIKNPQNASSGGLKDFCVQKLGIPSITLEIGSDALSHPISSKHLPEIFEKHKNIANDLNFAYNVFMMI